MPGWDRLWCWLPAILRKLDIDSAIANALCNPSTDIDSHVAPSPAIPRFYPIALSGCLAWMLSVSMKIHLANLMMMMISALDGLRCALARRKLQQSSKCLLVAPREDRRLQSKRPCCYLKLSWRRCLHWCFWCCLWWWWCCRFRCSLESQMQKQIGFTFHWGGNIFKINRQKKIELRLCNPSNKKQNNFSANPKTSMPYFLFKQFVPFPPLIIF